MDEHDQTDFSALEAKVDELIALCDALLRENRTLREQHQALQADHGRLLERKDLAATKLDALIGRMRSADQADAAVQDHQPEP